MSRLGLATVFPVGDVDSNLMGTSSKLIFNVLLVDFMRFFAL